jgi:copper oxidase (laccase) domain-containing protein
MTKYPSEIFQDIDGAYSAKRTAFFIFVVLIAACFPVVLAVHDRATLDYLHQGMATLADLVKWIGALIATEQMTKFAGRKAAP